MPDSAQSLDPVAAYLAEVRRLVSQRDELVNRVTAVGVPEFNAAQDRLAERTPPLLTALEAVLAQVDQAKEVRDYSGYETGGRLVGWNLNPAKLREAISAALMEEGSG